MCALPTSALTKWVTIEPEFTGDLLLSKWQNFLSCFSLCLVNVYCSFEWQNSLTQEVLELLIKAKSSMNEQENNACKHSMELWHSSICNFRKAMSLYPLAFYKEGWNLKLDGSTYTCSQPCNLHTMAPTINRFLVQLWVPPSLLSLPTW